MGDGRCELRISRNLPTDIKLRDIHIYLDQEHIGDLFFGKSLTREISVGSHELLFDNTLLKKKVAIELQENQVCSIEAGNVSAGCMSVFITVLGVGPYGLYVSKPVIRDIETG
ncbi:MAG: hypothetical protein U0R49_06040 [Fimbriimonadales bacterium]